MGSFKNIIICSIVGTLISLSYSIEHNFNDILSTYSLSSYDNHELHKEISQFILNYDPKNLPVKQAFKINTFYANDCKPWNLDFSNKCVQNAVYDLMKKSGKKVSITPDLYPFNNRILFTQNDKNIDISFCD